jgi:hypothetical protein
MKGIAMKKIMMVPCAEKDLIIVFWGQVALGATRGNRNLRTHHDRVNKAAQQ